MPPSWRIHLAAGPGGRNLTPQRSFGPLMDVRSHSVVLSRRKKEDFSFETLPAPLKFPER